MNQPHSGASGQPPREASDERSGADGPLLERVLLETASSADVIALGDEDWQALLSVARRHSGLPFSREPVLVDMVEALLCRRLTNSAGAAQDWQPMRERIATTLLEDPPSCERLESLWGRLCEAVR